MPLADWAEQVGGSRVHVQRIVPPGADPRSYVLSDQQRQAIGSADVVLLNGLDLEPWIDEILDQARGTKMVVLEVSQFTGPLVERETLSGANAFEQGAAQSGPRAGPNQGIGIPPAVYSAYLWLDPGSAMGQVELVARTLTRADPDGVSVYRQNAARYTGELENLDGLIQRQINTWHWQSLLADDMFLYPFARHYSLPINPSARGKGAPKLDPRQPLLRDALRPARRAPDDVSSRPVIVVNPLAGQTYVELMQALAHAITSGMMAPQTATPK